MFSSSTVRRRVFACSFFLFAHPTLSSSHECWKCIGTPRRRYLICFILPAALAALRNIISHLLAYQIVSHSFIVSLAVEHERIIFLILFEVSNLFRVQTYAWQSCDVDCYENSSILHWCPLTYAGLYWQPCFTVYAGREYKLYRTHC